MALTALRAPIIFPGVMFGGGFAQLANMTGISASGHYTGFITRAPRDFTIADVSWFVNTLTANPSEVEVRIETISGGTFSGTLWGANTNAASGNITSTGWRTETLTAPAVISKGDYFGVKFAWVSGNLSLGRVLAANHVPTALPFVVQNGSKANFNQRMILALSDGAGDYLEIGSLPAIAIASQTFNNTGTRSRGLRFQVPVPCLLFGVLICTSSSPGDCNVVLADAAGTTIATAAHVGSNTAGGTGDGMILVPFDTPQELAANTTYYVMQEPTSGTNSLINIFTLNSSALLNALPGGAQCYYAERTTAGGGAPTDDNTKYPGIELLLGGFDGGAGGGGDTGGLTRFNTGFN